MTNPAVTGSRRILDHRMVRFGVTFSVPGNGAGQKGQISLDRHTLADFAVFGLALCKYTPRREGAVDLIM